MGYLGRGTDRRHAKRVSTERIQCVLSLLQCLMSDLEIEFFKLKCIKTT